MQRQEINLYKKMESPGAAWNYFSWENFYRSQIGMAVFLLFVYFFSIWHTHSLKKEKYQTENKIVELRSQFLRLKKSYPDILFSNNVLLSLSQLEDELRNQQALINTIVNRISFSGILISLSQNIVPDVWLTQIVINNGGKNIYLKGNSLTMENIKKFIDNLFKDKIFSAFNFNLKNIEHNENAGNDTINFEILMTKKT